MVKSKIKILTVATLAFFAVVSSSAALYFVSKIPVNLNNQTTNSNVALPDANNANTANAPSSVNSTSAPVYVGPPVAISLSPGDYKYTLKQNGKDRYYLLHIPKTYNKKSSPLILAFHGGLGNAEQMAENYGLKEKSDKEGFIVAFPNGASRLASGKAATWNAGNCCGYAKEIQSDDVGFVKMVISDIKKKVNVDKVFAAGMSNGSMLSHRLACDMADTFTAVAAVAGTLNYDNCHPQKPVSVLNIHSLIDDHVLFYGGKGPAAVSSEPEFTSVPYTVFQWVNKNKCSKTPKRVLENNLAYCDLYSGCQNNSQVKLCVTKDGGHSWPGNTRASNPLEKSAPSQAISANDEIWNFFKTKLSSTSAGASIDITNYTGGSYSKIYHDTLKVGEEKYYYFRAKADKRFGVGPLENMSIENGGSSMEIFSTLHLPQCDGRSCDFDVDIIVSNEKQPSCADIGKFEQNIINVGRGLTAKQRLAAKYPAPWYYQFLGLKQAGPVDGEVVSLGENYTDGKWHYNNGDIFYLTVCGKYQSDRLSPDTAHGIAISHQDGPSYK